MAFAIDEKVFGNVKSYIQVIEFQNRGRLNPNCFLFYDYGFICCSTFVICRGFYYMCKDFKRDKSYSLLSCAEAQFSQLM